MCVKIWLIDEPRNKWSAGYSHRKVGVANWILEKIDVGENRLQKRRENLVREEAHAHEAGWGGVAHVL